MSYRKEKGKNLLTTLNHKQLQVLILLRTRMPHLAKKIRDAKYLSVVRGEPCLICFKEGEAHHIMYAEPRGVGLKVGDNRVVPLCHEHHMSIHHYGNEKKWWIF